MKKGYTLIEAIVALGVFSIVFAAIMGILMHSDRSWRVSYNKIGEQDQARRAMQQIAGLLRGSSPNWILSNVSYPVSILGCGTRIDFYVPVFNASGEIEVLKKVTFKPDPANATQLLKKEGLSLPVVIATSVQSLSISCACAGCTGINENCSLARVDIVTRKNTDFLLSSEVLLRNRNISVLSSVVIEEPTEGEF